MASTPIYDYTNSNLESSLSTRTRIQAERPEILGSIRGRSRHIFLLNRVQTVSEPDAALHSIGERSSTSLKYVDLHLHFLVRLYSLVLILAQGHFISSENVLKISGLFFLK
jgi:hypothetical protein